MTIANPSNATDARDPIALAYAEPDLRRTRPTENSRWAVPAYLMAALATVYALVFAVGIFHNADKWAALWWFVYGVVGSWTGVGLGLVFGFVGCLQRRRRRAWAAHSIWVNALVGVTPITLFGVPALFDGARDLTPVINVFAAWVCVFLGIFAGVVLGLWYHRENWLGGYGSWPRRMLRLGHISFFGLAAINIGYALTLATLGWRDPHPACSIALAASNFLMPLVCALVAWRPNLRHLFALPVVCASTGVGGLLIAQIGG